MHFSWLPRLQVQQALHMLEQYISQDEDELQQDAMEAVVRQRDAISVCMACAMCKVHGVVYLYPNDELSVQSAGWSSPTHAEVAMVPPCMACQQDVQRQHNRHPRCIAMQGMALQALLVSANLATELLNECHEQIPSSLKTTAEALHDHALLVRVCRHRLVVIHQQ